MCEDLQRASAEAIALVAGVGIGESFDPRGSFVYLLWGKDTARPLYVGESGNVLQRLGAHMSDSGRRNRVERIQLISCASKTGRRALETQLIGKYRPPWNLVGLPNIAGLSVPENGVG